MDDWLARLPGPMRRAAWFVVLWCAGVASVGVAAFAIRAMIL